MAPPAFYISTYMFGNVLSDSMADYYEDATIALINNGGIGITNINIINDIYVNMSLYVYMRM